MVATMPFSWIPLTRAAAPKPARTGSSPMLSKPRPPSGERCIFIVGPQMTRAPFALASSPIRRPASSKSFWSNVLPRAVPQGKQAAGTLLKAFVPRTPLGPSERRNEGTLWSGRPCVCQKSIPEGEADQWHVLSDENRAEDIPARSETFSTWVSLDNTTSTSMSAIL